MNEIIILVWLRQLTGLDETSIVFLLGMAYAVANFLARSIPESEKGWKGLIRTIASYVALYRSKKLAAGVTVTDVTQAMADHGIGLGNLPVVRKGDGQFVSTKSDGESNRVNSPLLAALAALFLAAILLSACTNTTQKVCNTAARAKPIVDETVRQCEIRGVY